MTDEEQRRVDAALRESEARHRLFVESWAQAVWETNAAGVVVEDSPSWRAYTGQTLEEWLGYGWLDAIHPDDRAYADRQWREAVSARSLLDAEYRLRTPDGGWRWTNVRAAPLIDANGDIEKWFGLNIDIDDRKRAEAAVRENDERQAFLLRLSDALTCLSESSDMMAEASRLSGEHLGLDRCGYGEVDLGLNHIAFPRWYQAPGISSFPTEVPLQQYDERLVADIAAGNVLVMNDIQADASVSNTAKQEYAAVKIAAFVVVPLIKNRRLVAILSAHQSTPRNWSLSDIRLLREVLQRTAAFVERARAETALRTSEERLRQFGNASRDVIWIRDAQTLQWTYLTPAFETIYGISRDEALRGDTYRNWVELIVPEDREYATEMIQRVRQGEHVTFEYRVRRPVDGEIRWLRDTDFPITNKHGKIVSVGGIGHDTTELREAELRFRTLLEGIPQLVLRAVDHGRWTWASPQWTEFTGQAEADSHGLGWLQRVHPDDRDAAMTAWSHAMETGGFSVEYRLCHADEGYSWFSTRATPVRGDDGTIMEWLGTSTDIHSLRQLQDRQRILLAELQHRVRNIIAMIRSMARRTSEGPATVGDYVEHFEGRINAMARTQALLTRTPGAGVDLQNLVRDELEAQATKPTQYSCRGPDIALSPKAAEVLTLAIHELATNAIKYGALGVPDGLVNIEWSKEQGSGRDWLRLDWSELRVTLPADHGQRKGFGTELITRRVPYELKGRGKIEFKPTGLHARIEFPLIPGQSILQTDAGHELHTSERKGT